MVFSYFEVHFYFGVLLVRKDSGEKVSDPVPARRAVVIAIEINAGSVGDRFGELSLSYISAIFSW